MTEDKVPQGRREVWLSVANAVIGGLPEPQECTLYDHQSIWLVFDTPTAALAWIDYVGADFEPGTSTVRRDDGWLWHVKAQQQVTR